MSNEAPIKALFFDLDGHGPDHLEFKLYCSPELDALRTAPQLGLMVVVAEKSPTHFTMPGGFVFDFAGAEDLHRRVGAWIDAHRDANEAAK